MTLPARNRLFFVKAYITCEAICMLFIVIDSFHSSTNLAAR